MKISDIVALAKAGYKPADVLKLMEVVETSPEVKKVEAVVDETTGDVSINKTDDKTPKPENEQGGGEDDITKLVNLLKEEK